MSSVTPIFQLPIPTTTDPQDQNANWGLVMGAVDNTLRASAFRNYPTLAAMNLEATTKDGDRSTVSNIPGAYFVRMGTAWVMQGAGVFSSAAARDAAITAPLNGMRAWRTDLGYEEGYFTAWNATTNPRGHLTARWAPTLPWARAKGIQTTPNGAWNAGQNLGFNVFDDPDSLWDATSAHFKIKVPGAYQVSIQAKQSSTSSFAVVLWVNGASQITTFNSPTTQYSGVAMNTTLRFNPGDTVAMRVNANMTIQADPPAEVNYLSLVQVQI